MQEDFFRGVRIIPCRSLHSRHQEPLTRRGTRLRPAALASGGRSADEKVGRRPAPDGWKRQRQRKRSDEGKDRKGIDGRGGVAAEVLSITFGPQRLPRRTAN